MRLIDFSGGYDIKKKKIGMRNIKTGIAVIICVLVGNLILDNTFFAVVACVISMQNTVKASLKTGVHYNSIMRCCRKERNKAGGFIWRYYEDENVEVAI